MNKYKKQISKAIKLNYKGKTFFSERFIKDFLSYRENCLDKIINSKDLEKKIDNNDSTYHWLKNEYLNIKNKKNNQKKHLIYYKKFEINYGLKKKYSIKDIKLTNKETHIESYIFLGLIITKIKQLNIYQKLNCILKISDKLLLNEKYLFLNKTELIKLLKWEMRFILKLLHEK